MTAGVAGAEPAQRVSPVLFVLLFYVVFIMSP